MKGRLVWHPFDVQSSCGEGDFDGAGYETLKHAKQAAREHLRLCDHCQRESEGLIITTTGLVYPRKSSTKEAECRCGGVLFDPPTHNLKDCPSYKEAGRDD